MRPLILLSRRCCQFVPLLRRIPQKDGQQWTALFSSTTKLSMSTDDDAQSATNAFDRNMKRQQRDNAARAHEKWRNHVYNLAAAAAQNEAPSESKQQQQQHDQEPQSTPSATTRRLQLLAKQKLVSYDYIRKEIATRLVDRLDDIQRAEGFPLALDMGSGSGYIHRAICAEPALQEGGGGIGGVRKLVQLDSSKLMLHRDADIPVKGGDLCDSYRLEADEEVKLPFPSGTFDLVISSASLHWVNKLPSVLAEIKRVLKPDGCFMWAMIGGTTLPELRVALLMAELEREGGVSPHVGPFVGIADVGGLLQRAGFTLPTIDVDTFKVSFPNAAILMEHLQRMGENAAGLQRKKTRRTGVDTFLAAACIYEQLYGITIENHSNDGGTQDQPTNPSLLSPEIEATVNVIYAIGWTPHESQPKPLERGSATSRIQDHVSKNR